jgi:iron complex outermembrane receptor protein
MPDVGRVLRGVSQPGMNVESLLNLAPLVTENIEFGAEYNGARGGVQFAWFESTSDFGIRLVPDADGIFSVNREETEIDGWELSGNFEASELLNFAFGAAFLDGKFDSNDDGSVDADLGAQDIGSDRVNFSVNITPPGDWSYRLQSFTYLDETFRNAAGTATAQFEGYTVVDFLAAWALNDQTRLTFALSNLFDEQYLTYYSQAGNTRADRYNAGRGRTLSVKANFRF